MDISIFKSASNGYCKSCGKSHYIKQGMAKKYCLDLMQTMENSGRIDFNLPEKDADPRLTLDYIKGDARGQMFGVLECTSPAGKSVILKAFSGQYNGVWEVDGWVPPLLDVNKFNELVFNVDKEIKALGKKIDNIPEGAERQIIIQQRKKMSQDLMKEIHELYLLRNFRNQSRPLSDFFKKGIPTGAGDCCAPKLLNAAAKLNLQPVSLAEIYWGRTNRSGTRTQGQFYTACEEKCQPILGFMLCGLT